MLKNYFNHKTVWMSLLAVVAVMVFIFIMSAQTQDESSETSGRIVDIFIDVFLPGFDELPIGEQTDKLDVITNVIRKLAHFTEYAVLGIFLALHFNELKSRLNCKAELWQSTIVGILYAISDEFHQYFVPGRGPGIKDVFIDTLGVFTGFVIILCILKRKSRNTEQNEA